MLSPRPCSADLSGFGDFTHRPLSSSFLELTYRILNINHKKELLRGLWGVSTRLLLGVYRLKAGVLGPGQVLISGWGGGRRKREYS